MVGGDGADDGQAEAVAAVAAGGARAEPLEGLEPTGSNTVVLNGVTVTGYQAGPGWDPVTGWGTPDAQVLIPPLAG